MKRIAPLLLLIIVTTTFIYNVIGLHLLVSLEKEQNWIDAMKQIPTTEYKVIKLNATLYSFIEDEEMEYVNENITLKNKVYHVFKKEIKDNIIRLYYLPNKQQSSTDLVLKKVVDNELYENNALSKKPLEKIFKSFIKDYIPIATNEFEFVSKVNCNPLKISPHFDGILHSGYLKQAYSPPKTA